MYQSRKIVLLSAMAAAITFGAIGVAAAAGQAAEPAAVSVGTRNVAAVSTILNRWEAVAELAGAHPSYWREQFAAVLNLMPSQALAKLAKLPVGDASTARDDYASFTKAMKSGQMAVYAKLFDANGKGQLKTLGSATDNLVFVPTQPCRIVDTRLASGGSGAIVAGTTKTFFAYSANSGFSWATQGGPAGLANQTCPGTTLTANGGVLGAVGPNAAVATVTVVNATAAGNWLIWGGNGAAPAASALNWTAGEVLANTTVIPMGTRTGGNQDFAIRFNGPTGSADVVVDVVGYFVESSATALDCYIQDNFGNGTNNFLAGTNLTITVPACASGYSRTATQCFVGLGGTLPNVYLLEVDETGCYWHNATASTLNQGDYDTEALCCRVPGQ